MTNNAPTTEPTLAPPGAGLPLFERLIAKYILLPRIFKNQGNKDALHNFAKESETILDLSSKLPIPMLAERRLIPRLRGLEDSSRYYSVAMTLQHLVIVGHSIRHLISDLTKGATTLKAKGVEAFKPDPNVDPENILTLFDQMSEQFLYEMEAADIDAHPQATYPHPWFGPFNASKWLAMAATHQNVHRHQIKAIIARL